ncbi:glioma pathogenesis-related protein 1-like isoform X2 [Paroedura picta]|uniref:glioma pathogenesis-related protein 1-like isoform X2 n=1 Tax=Paroedura picta TaxID=143630 RepID=UPI0040561F43
MKCKLCSWLWLVLELSVCCYAYEKTSLPNIEDQQFIQDCVKIHNYFRSRVNPSASNMQRMTWDPALAKTAKAWAKKCHFDHNIYLKTPGKVHPKFTPVGENIWTGSLSLFSVNGSVKNCFFIINAYVYLQKQFFYKVVWATSYKVGCAVQFCQRVLGFHGLSNGAHFVCNYGPAGNYPVKPYKTGNPCSECNREKCADNLCENPERDQLLSYSSWSPDWDIPAPPTSRSTCDSYCITVLVLRLLFILLTFGIVAMLFKKYPQMFIYE